MGWVRVWGRFSIRVRVGVRGLVLGLGLGLGLGPFLLLSRQTTRVIFFGL